MYFSSLGSGMSGEFRNPVGASGCGTEDHPRAEFDLRADLRGEVQFSRFGKTQRAEIFTRLNRMRGR